MKSPIQKILFGSPGTGKSYKITKAPEEEDGFLAKLKIEEGTENHIPVVFHPEYTYGDFIGKLMPISQGKRVTYNFYSGHFLKALGLAYKHIAQVNLQFEEKIKEEKKKHENISDEEIEMELKLQNIMKEVPPNVALVIDEINRGNSAAIFGTVFQLLDREEDGWSSYSITLSDMEYEQLLAEVGITSDHEYDEDGNKKKERWKFEGKFTHMDSVTKKNKMVDGIYESVNKGRGKNFKLTDRKILIPPNLSLIATMNTSDNSIYFMDNAFKRRWDWEFVNVDIGKDSEVNKARTLWDGFLWVEFIDNLNAFIRSQGDKIRKVEDKQVGYFFIKGAEILEEDFRNKLMFFLWDSVFNTKKQPLYELLGLDKKDLVTFGDFIRNATIFIDKIKNKDY